MAATRARRVEASNRQLLAKAEQRGFDAVPRPGSTGDPLCLHADLPNERGRRHGLTAGVQSMATVADGPCVALDPASAVSNPA